LESVEGQIEVIWEVAQYRRFYIRKSLLNKWKRR